MSSKSEVSSKRLITFLAFILIFFIALIDLFTEYVVTDYVYEGLVLIAAAGLGTIATEAFSKSKPQKELDDYTAHQAQNSSDENVLI